MQDATYQVMPDHGDRMLRIDVHGFWDEPTMAAYLRAVRAAMATLQRGGGCRSILVDMSDFPIQPQSIAEAHAALLRGSSQIEGLRVALVMRSALSKMQANRLAADVGYRTFETALEAEAWLREGEGHTPG